jgi:hypothetical protein
VYRRRARQVETFVLRRKPLSWIANTFPRGVIVRASRKPNGSSGRALPRRIGANEPSAFRFSDHDHSRRLSARESAATVERAKAFFFAFAVSPLP